MIIERIRQAIDTLPEGEALAAVRAILAEPIMHAKEPNTPLPLTKLGDFNTPDGRAATVYKMAADVLNAAPVPKHNRMIAIDGVVQPNPPPTQPNRTDRLHPSTQAALAAEKSSLQDLTDSILKQYKS